ncbi:MAG: hypothetical protein AAF688_07985 [Bacteroidota bacterium]
MQLSKKHIEFIESSLSLYGLKDQGLREDLVDHICTYIENEDGHDFNYLYQKALRKFGGYASFQNLQLETNYQKFAKQIVTINRLKFGAGFLTILFLLLSLVFQMFHWPYANAWLIGALAIAILFILPVHFYANYKRSVIKFS